MRFLPLVALALFGCEGAVGGSGQSCARLTLGGSPMPSFSDWSQGKPTCLHNATSIIGTPEFILSLDTQSIGVFGLNVGYNKTFPVGPIRCMAGGAGADDNVQASSGGGTWHSESGSITVSAQRPFRVTYAAVVMVPVPKCNATDPDNPAMGGFTLDGTATFEK